MNSLQRSPKAFVAAVLGIFIATGAQARTEPVKYGDMNQWITREIKESSIIGGKEKTLYEIGPARNIAGNLPYRNEGGSPWATSNVYAKVTGVTKGSNAVYPYDRGNGNKACKMASQLESVKVLGLINMDVMVAGSIFLGWMIEPITSTSNPYAKMEMGVPIKERPTAVIFDYKVDMPATDTRLKSTGFSKKKILPGRDTAAMFVLLQRRWETPDGKLHAKRVATGGETYPNNVPEWINGHSVALVYGDVSANPKYAWLPLRSGDNCYYAHNSKGKLVKVEEEGWDSANATPTHIILLFSAGNGDPYVGTPGLNFYVDNIALAY